MYIERENGGLTAVKLGVGKETDKVGAVARLHMVALEVERYVAKGGGIAVNIERANVVAGVFAGCQCLVYLGTKELGKV